MPQEPLTGDRQPGRLPEIRETDAGVTFVLEFDDANIDRQQLLLRCDAGGNVWVSIVPPPCTLPNQPS